MLVSQEQESEFTVGTGSLKLDLKVILCLYPICTHNWMTAYPQEWKGFPNKVVGEHVFYYIYSIDHIPYLYLYTETGYNQSCLVNNCIVCLELFYILFSFYEGFYLAWWQTHYCTKLLEEIQTNDYYYDISVVPPLLFEVVLLDWARQGQSKNQRIYPTSFWTHRELWRHWNPDVK